VLVRMSFYIAFGSISFINKFTGLTLKIGSFQVDRLADPGPAYIRMTLVSSQL
jgi:hypothetical protein